MRLLEPDQISNTQSMMAKRGRTSRANVHVKKSFKTQRGRIPDQSIWLQSFHGKKKKKRKLKMLTCESEITRAKTRNRRPFLEPKQKFFK